MPPTGYNPERYVPYRLLWAKVIVRAAYDYALWKDSKDTRLRNYAKDAERWLFETSELMNSFDRICEVMDLDRTKIRNYARNLTRDQVKKLEFMEREGRDLVREFGFVSSPREPDDDGDSR